MGFRDVQESNNLGVELFEKEQFLGASVAFQQALEQLYKHPSSQHQQQHKSRTKTGIKKFIRHHWSKRVYLSHNGDTDTEGLFIHQRALYIYFDQSTRMAKQNNSQLFLYGGSLILFNYALCLHMIFLTEACPHTIAKRAFRLYEMAISAICDPAVTAAILNNSGHLLTEQGRKLDAVYCFQEVSRILTIDVTESLGPEDAHGIYLNTYMIHANTACAA